MAAAHLINRTSSTLLKKKSPFEILNGTPPTVSHLRVLGCLAYAHNKDTKGDKFASRSRRYILLGYPSGTKGWKLFDLEKETVFISRDVEFQEHVFPFLDTQATSSSSPVPPITLPPSTDDDVDATSSHITHTTLPQEVSDTSVATDKEHNESPGTSETEHHQEPLGCGHRTHKPSTRYRDYVINSVTAIPSTLSLSRLPFHRHPQVCVIPYLII